MYEPIGQRVIIEPEKITETDNGLDRADQGQSMPAVGFVIATGKGTWRKLWTDGSRFKVGQKLMFRRYSVDEIKFPATNGSIHCVFCCEDADIVAIVSE